MVSPTTSPAESAAIRVAAASAAGSSSPAVIFALRQSIEPSERTIASATFRAHL
jgi:hypothetical protein